MVFFEPGFPVMLGLEQHCWKRVRILHELRLLAQTCHVNSLMTLDLVATRRAFGGRPYKGGVNSLMVVIFIRVATLTPLTRRLQ
jgi:hypothetical protein